MKSIAAQMMTAAFLMGALCAPVFAQQPASSGQSAVASKTVKFGRVLPADPALAKALDAKDLTGAQKYVGKEGAFVGTVFKAYAPKSNDLVILNFASNYREALTAVVKSAQYASFPDMKTLEGKKVLVTGKFTAYQGRPEIDLLKPGQIKIVASKP